MLIEVNIVDLGEPSLNYFLSPGMGGGRSTPLIIFHPHWEGKTYPNLTFHMIQEKGFTTLGLRDFIKHCGANPDQYTKVRHLPGSYMALT